jgi:rSAM/selenodomain-associated transferase 1
MGSQFLVEPIHLRIDHIVLRLLSNSTRKLSREMKDEHLIVFVKAPRPRAVKTRLAQAVGSDAACAAYRLLAETLFTRLSSLRNVQLRFTPDDAGDQINLWLRNGWKKKPQGEGDLGTRLVNAFEDAFRCGFKRVVIIGSDCPEVQAGDAEAAWAALQDHDVVLGPAIDGGYWLIGLRREQPVLFEKVSWSSKDVFSQTLTRAESAGLRTKLLRELSDVDTEEDWRAFLLKTEKSVTLAGAAAGSAKSRQGQK